MKSLLINWETVVAILALVFSVLPQIFDKLGLTKWQKWAKHIEQVLNQKEDKCDAREQDEKIARIVKELTKEED